MDVMLTRLWDLVCDIGVGLRAWKIAFEMHGICVPPTNTDPPTLMHCSRDHDLGICISYQF